MEAGIRKAEFIKKGEFSSALLACGTTADERGPTNRARSDVLSAQIPHDEEQVLSIIVCRFCSSI